MSNVSQLLRLAHFVRPYRGRIAIALGALILGRFTSLHPLVLLAFAGLAGYVIEQQ